MANPYHRIMPVKQQPDREPSRPQPRPRPIGGGGYRPAIPRPSYGGTIRPDPGFSRPQPVRRPPAFGVMRPGQPRPVRGGFPGMPPRRPLRPMPSRGGLPGLPPRRPLRPMPSRGRRPVFGSYGIRGRNARAVDAARANRRRSMQMRRHGLARQPAFTNTRGRLDQAFGQVNNAYQQGMDRAQPFQQRRAAAAGQLGAARVPANNSQQQLTANMNRNSQNMSQRQGAQGNSMRAKPVRRASPFARMRRGYGG